MATIIEMYLTYTLMFMSLVYNIIITAKSLKAKKKAGTLTQEDTENAWLKVKEIARNAIYTAEAQFSGMAKQGLKCGSFKLDSVLKTVDIECLKQGLSYDRAEVESFVNEEVNKMKEVK